MLEHRRFTAYWSCIILSEIGARGTIVANYFHVYELTGSTLQTGLVGFAQAVALVLISPLAGAYVDRLDRARLLQAAQGASLAISLTLAVLTISGRIAAWHILLSVLVNTAAEALERPSRNALIPALVPRRDLVQAFALVNPSRELAVLLGPAMAGLLIAGGGVEWVYVVDTASYAVLIVVVGLLRIPTERAPASASVWADVAEGFRWVAARPLVVQLIGLDLSASLFATYRAVLPALAVDVLGVDAAGYGVLSAAPSAGALIGTALLFPLLRRVGAGTIVIAATAGYGLGIMGLGRAPVFALAVGAAVVAGAMDAMATSVRQAAVQLEVPDSLRGRVTATYGIASRGGPALGEVLVGGLAGLVGPASALVLGGLVPLGASLAARGGRSAVSGYTTDARAPG